MINKLALSLIIGMFLIAGAIAGVTLTKTDKQIEVNKDCKTILDANGWTALKLGVTSCYENGICNTPIMNYEREFDTLVFNEGTNIQVKRDKALTKLLNKECERLKPSTITKEDKLGEGDITLKEKK